MDFDQYATTYETEIERVAGVSVAGLAREKARMALDIIALKTGAPGALRALDFGCGIGLVDQHVEAHVAELTGVDISARSLEVARRRAPKTHFAHFDGTKLAFADERFDAVFAIGVLLLVPIVSRGPLIAEMTRVLAPGGVMILMEHNPYNPATRWIVARCALDADSNMLSRRESSALLRGAGLRDIGCRYYGFLPFRHKLVRRGERALSWLPIGAQYCVFGVKPGKS